MDYYSYSESHGKSFNHKPKSDNQHSNSIFENSSYGKLKSFERDALNDLIRWVSGFRKIIDKYTEQKYLYEKEKKLKIENESDRQEMKLQVSDDKGYLEDMRKGFDWYVDAFGETPTVYEKLVKDLSMELNRLKRLKKYLSYRVRSLAGRGMYNESSKDILQYIRIRIDAISILFDPKYNERTPLEDIYGLDEFEDDEDYDIYKGENPNKLFHNYD